MRKKIPVSPPAGFTLVELILASAILIIAVSGILLSFLRALELNEVSRNSSLAVQAARSQMELMKATVFNQVKLNFDQTAFAVNGLNGMGVTYVDDADPTQLEVTASVSWQQKNGRVYGEDLDLDGATDAGEDANLNGILDSPVQVTSYIFQR